MKKDFLLEILVQELPYKFIPSAIEQLKSSFKKLFSENALAYDDIKVYATPRRLSVIVSNLALKQDTIEKDAKGPIISVAKDEKGNYSPAAIGFAKKNNVELSALYEKDNYIWAKIKIEGKEAKDILKDNVESLILKLQGSHFMRWGYNTEKFSRPIENVVAMLDNEVVDLKILDKVATNKTQGHRYSSNRNVTLDGAKTYVSKLKQANVIVDQDERKQMIVDLAQECAIDNGLCIKFDNIEELLEEVTFITEYPVPVLCDFDKKYLQIPDIVTTTVMSSHQRYFPLWDKNDKLSNHFITMANYVGNEFSNIKAGNQRVICARLEDGVFFYQDDTKTKLIDKLDSLSGMTFQKGLGTLLDKTNRMIRIADKICDILNISSKEDILRSAKISKCDLSSKLVFEFTELQGFIGQSYALVDGEKENIAKAICEHYYPLSANSELPSSIEGQIVSIADKIDTICALFISTQGDKKKKRPTGSNDPLGARRAVIGVLRTIIEYNLNIDLDEIINYSLSLLSEEFNIALEDTILSELRDFFIARLLVMYEKELNQDVVKSCLIFNPLKNLSGFIKRVKTISKHLENNDFNILKENASRVVKILKDTNNILFDESLLVLDEEKALYKAIKEHNQSKDDLDKYIESLNVLNKYIISFFDKVLVMDKDEKIKNNRLALLLQLKEKFDAVCDFSVL